MPTTPLALAGAAWTLGMVQRSAGDTDGAIGLATEAAGLLQPRLEDGTDELRAMYGALQLHAATTAARAGRDGDAWRHWDTADATARRLGGYDHPWTMFGSANVKLHAVSISADLSRSGEAHGHAEQIDPEEIPSRERRGRLGVEIARAYYQRRDYPATLHWLETAYAHLARQRAVLADRQADDRRHRGPRRAADQPQGAVACREHRPAPVAQGRTVRLSPGSREARSCMHSVTETIPPTHDRVRRETDGMRRMDESAPGTES